MDFDQYMVFDVHIDEIRREVNDTPIYLNGIQDSLGDETGTIVIQSLAMSIINYCFKEYDLTTKQQLHPVQKLQNFAAKIVDGKANKYDHISPILKKLHLI